MITPAHRLACAWIPCPVVPATWAPRLLPRTTELPMKVAIVHDSLNPILPAEY